MGFALSGLTYKIENRNVKFYLKEDYFYKNSVWSADIPLEINANGVRRGFITDELGTHYMYPHFKFWEKVAEAKAKVVISADCHNPALLNDSDVQKCRDIAKNWGLHVIDAID